MDNPEAGSRPPAGTPDTAGGPAGTPHVAGGPAGTPHAAGGPAGAAATAPGNEPPTWPSIGAWSTGEQPRAYGGYPPRRPTNGLAIAALVLGGVSLVSCPPIGAVAVYLGNRARNEIRTSGEDGDSFALAGVILGWCALAVAAAMVLLAAVYFGLFAVLFGVFAATGSG